MKSLVEIQQEHRFSTDKGDPHSYLEVYDILFAPHRATASRILEIGIKRGGSLSLWDRYFDHAEVIGVDIDEISLPTMPRNKIIGYRANAYRPETVQMLRREVGQVDIIIDDGSHQPRDMRFVAEHYGPMIQKGGLLIIEDLGAKRKGGGFLTIEECREAIMIGLPTWLRRKTMLIDRRYISGRGDDVLFVVSM